MEIYDNWVDYDLIKKVSYDKNLNSIIFIWKSAATNVYKSLWLVAGDGFEPSTYGLWELDKVYSIGL